jgi:hypothetical protein
VDKYKPFHKGFFTIGINSQYATEIASPCYARLAMTIPLFVILRELALSLSIAKHPRWGKGSDRRISAGIVVTQLRLPRPLPRARNDRLPDSVILSSHRLREDLGKKKRAIVSINQAKIPSPRECFAITPPGFGMTQEMISMYITTLKKICVYPCSSVVGKDCHAR